MNRITRVWLSLICNITPLLEYFVCRWILSLYLSWSLGTSIFHLRLFSLSQSKLKSCFSYEVPGILCLAQCAREPYVVFVWGPCTRRSIF
ncbi:hypothetical protein BDZ45DRAFT_36299 [Acephala macrosclerotiorum]|nr:hypothetical protein BDZ45DRAFT_36299 [Acephala macrosclerotiorum]